MERTSVADERNDGRLLAAYLAGDAGAFEQLTRRHAAMVLSACRRLLGPGPDAEDAAQATFLVLLRRAGALTGQPEIGHWLHRAAVLVSRNALRARSRQAQHEKEAAQMRARGDAAGGGDRPWQEVAGRLDGALDALPAEQRQALVLCYFEGLSQSQAAGRVGLPESTLANRCARGLERLRERLGVRDRRLGAGALGALILAHAAAGAPELLIKSVTAAAAGAAAGAPILALAEGALKVMFWTKVKLAAAAVAAAAVLGAGTPLVVHAISAERDAKPGAGAASAPAPEPKNEPVAVDGLKLTLAAGKSEAKAGEEVKLTLTFENVSKEKLRVFWPIERYLGDQVALEASGPGVQRSPVMRDMMALMPGLANFPELAPGDKKTLEIKLAGNPPAVGKLGVTLTKEGAYKVRISYTYKNANPTLDDLDGGGKPVPGKVWNGTVQSQELELKLSGEFKPAPKLIRGPGGGVGLPVPEELMPDRNPQPAPGKLEEM